jgi:hypothetical protein
MHSSICIGCCLKCFSLSCFKTRLASGDYRHQGVTHQQDLDEELESILIQLTSPLKFIVDKSEQVANNSPCPDQDLHRCPLANFALLLPPVAVSYRHYFCCGAKVEVEVDAFLGSLVVYVQYQDYPRLAMVQGTNGHASTTERPWTKISSFACCNGLGSPCRVVIIFLVQLIPFLFLFSFDNPIQHWDDREQEVQSSIAGHDCFKD